MSEPAQRKNLSLRLEQMVRELYRNGFRTREIAEAFGISASTVSRVVNRGPPS